MSQKEIQDELHEKKFVKTYIMAVLFMIIFYYCLILFDIYKLGAAREVICVLCFTSG